MLGLTIVVVIMMFLNIGYSIITVLFIINIYIYITDKKYLINLIKILLIEKELIY
jgi:hypothetical protein